MTDPRLANRELKVHASFYDLHRYARGFYLVGCGLATSSLTAFDAGLVDLNQIENDGVKDFAMFLVAEVTNNADKIFKEKIQMETN
jgi:hypothetical protein